MSPAGLAVGLALPVWLAEPCPHGGWAALGASLDLRPAAEVAETLWARGGCVRPSGLRWGAELGLSPLRGLDALGEGYGYRAVDLGVGASWWAGDAWGPGLGVSLVASRLQFVGPWQRVEAGWVPRLGVEAGWVVPVGERVGLTPTLGGTADLRRVELSIGGVPREVLPPFELRVGLAVLLPAPEAGR